MTENPWVRWRNFRGFTDTRRVELRPLTVLLGPNNSGKSSLYKPLLLMKQTTESSRSRPGLITRGELVNAGTFEDLVPLGDAGTVIEFELGLHGRPVPSDDIEHVGHYPPGELLLQFVKGDQQDNDVSLRMISVRDVYGRAMLSRSRLPSGRFSMRLYSELREGEQVSPNKFDRALSKAIGRSKPEHFLFSGTSAFFEVLSSRVHRDDESGSPTESEIELSPRNEEYLKAVDFISQSTKRFLSSLHYLGPLRDFPRRVYEVSGEPPTGVGVRGEFAPELLFRGEGTGVSERVNEALHTFDLDADLTAVEVAEGLFMLGLKRRGWSRPINIADLGFGVSQVLPLVVQGLMLNENATMVAEQPEIHLNPRLQARLADFLVDLVNSGRRVLVETHSEHLVTRLRRRIADGDLDFQNVGVQFVEMQEGVSTVRYVPIDEYGHIDGSDWPKGFFEESLGEALALAASQSRKRASNDS